MLKATFRNATRSSNATRNSKGKPLFVYGVTGTPEELSKYEEIQGAYFRKDEKTGTPLFFSTRKLPSTTNKLSFNQDETRVYVDDGGQALEIEALLNDQFTPELVKIEVAKQIAASKVASIFGKFAAPASTPISQEKEVPESADPISQD